MRSDLWADSKSGGASARSALWLLDDEGADHSPLFSAFEAKLLEAENRWLAAGGAALPSSLMLAGWVSPIRPGSFDLMLARKPFWSATYSTCL